MQRQGTMMLPLRVHAVGSGGVDELGQAFNDATVSWSLLRFEIGSGSFARTKFVIIVCNGDDTPTVKRGRLNTRTSEALGIIGHSHVLLEIKRGVELTFEYLMEEVKKAFGADDMGDFSLDDMKAEYDKTNKEILMKRMAMLRSASESLPAVVEGDEEAAEAGAEPEGEVAPDDGKRKRNDKVSPDDALAQVGRAWGDRNWALIDAANMEAVFDSGSGGLEEMKEALAPEKVLFGGMRFTFPRDDSPPIIKFLIVHWIGPTVSAVKRGQWNAKLDDAKSKMRNHFDCTLQKAAHELSDLDAMDLINELKRLVYDTGSGGMKISLEWYMQGIQAEYDAKAARIAAASAPKPEAEPAAPEPEAPPEAPPPAPKVKQPEVSEALSSVRESGGLWNWTILAALREDDD